MMVAILVLLVAAFLASFVVDRVRRSRLQRDGDTKFAHNLDIPEVTRRGTPPPSETALREFHRGNGTGPV